jgi:hypothetical protein
MLGLRVVSVNSRCIISNDGGDEIGVVFGLFLLLRAGDNAVFFLVFAQQPRHKVRSDESHIELMLQTLLIRSIRQLDKVTNIVNRSPSAFSVSAIFSNVIPVEVYPEHSSSSSLSTDILPFFKCLQHSLVWVRPKALSPNVSLSILCVTTAVLPGLKQNMKQIRCSSTSFMLTSRYDNKTLLT